MLANHLEFTQLSSAFKAVAGICIFEDDESGLPVSWDAVNGFALEFENGQSDHSSILGITSEPSYDLNLARQGDEISIFFRTRATHVMPCKCELSVRGYRFSATVKQHVKATVFVSAESPLKLG